MLKISTDIALFKVSMPLLDNRLAWCLDCVVFYFISIITSMCNGTIVCEEFERQVAYLYSSFVFWGREVMC